MDVLIVCTVIFLLAFLAGVLYEYEEANFGIRLNRCKACYLSKNFKPHKIETPRYRLEFIKYSEKEKWPSEDSSYTDQPSAIFKVTNKTNKPIILGFLGGTESKNLKRDMIKIEKRFSGEINTIYCKEGCYTWYGSFKDQNFIFDSIIVYYASTK